MNMEDALSRVVTLAREAGEIAKRHFRTGNFTTQSKGGSDFLTQADSEVDTFLKDRLRRAFPDSQILTEETAPQDYSGLENAESLWIVDPIDGTTNFSRNDEHFAISIALVEKAKAKVGVVYLPVENKLYKAQIDKDNAYCNDQKIHVSDTAALETASVGYDWAWSMESREQMHAFVSKFMTKVRQPRALGSAASDLSLLAEGNIDVYINSGLKPWDIAAASLIIEKAGGILTTPHGEPFNVFKSDLVASNTILHHHFLELLK